jgi:hypothetical protein
MTYRYMLCTTECMIEDKIVIRHMILFFDKYHRVCYASKTYLEAVTIQ